jgi:hypothetical protein
MRRAEHAASMEAILIAKPESERWLERSRPRQGYNIKTNISER